MVFFDLTGGVSERFQKRLPNKYSIRKKICTVLIFPQRKTEFLHGVFTEDLCLVFEFTEHLKLFSLKIILNLSKIF